MYFTHGYRRIGLAILTSWLAGCSKSPSQRVSAIPRVGSLLYSDTITAVTPTTDRPACPRCEILIDSIGSIGSETDSIYPQSFSQVIEGADDLYYVAPVSARSRIAVFNTRGELVRMQGHAGDGPEELRQIGAIAPTKDSQLVVLSGVRFVYFAAGGRPVATKPLPQWLTQPRMVVQPDGTIIVATGSPELRNFEAYSPATGRVVTFGDSTAMGADSSWQRNALLTRWIALANGGSFLSIPEKLTTVVDQWTESGQFVRRYRLPAPWYGKTEERDLDDLRKYGIRGSRAALTTAIWADSRGLLWTLTSIRDPRWQLEKGVDSSTGHGAEPRQAGYWGFDRRKVRDGVIAVYALTDSSVRLISSRQVDIPFSSFLSDSVLTETVYADRNFTTYNLFRFRLRGFTHN
jgi:hypothetical protein